MNFLDPQLSYKQLLPARLGTVGGCASNQVGSSEPKTPGEQTRAMGSGWQMRQSHHGQPPAPWPPLTGPRARGPQGLRRGRHGHRHHTLVRSRAEPPPELLLPPPDPWLLSGNDDVPCCSGPSHLLREQAELFPFYSLVHMLILLSVPGEAQPPHLLPGSGGTDHKEPGRPRALLFGWGSQGHRPSPFSEQRRKLNPDQGSPGPGSPAAWPATPCRAVRKAHSHWEVGPGSGALRPRQPGAECPFPLHSVGHGAWGPWADPGEPAPTEPCTVQGNLGRERVGVFASASSLGSPLPRPQA